MALNLADVEGDSPAAKQSSVLLESHTEHVQVGPSVDGRGLEQRCWNHQLTEGILMLTIRSVITAIRVAKVFLQVLDTVMRIIRDSKCQSASDLASALSAHLRHSRTEPGDFGVEGIGE